MATLIEPPWTRRLRLARIARARKRKHHLCDTCAGERIVCAYCGNIICLTCADHRCRYAHLAVRGAVPIPPVLAGVPDELQPVLARIAARPIAVFPAELFSGYRIVFDRPSVALTIAEMRRTLIDPYLPHQWRAYGVGAEKAGTFYLDLERVP